MSFRNPMVACGKMCLSNAASCSTSLSLLNGDALFLLYSPSTARLSVLNSGSAYLRRWKRSASMASTVSRSSLENVVWRSEEHTSELQSLRHLVCRLLLEKKKKTKHN